jgi:hypothetical protein
MKRGRPSRRELSYEEFDAKHADELSALAESFGWRSQSEFESKTLGDALRFRGHALPDWAREFKRTPLCTLLAAAGRENCPARVRSQNRISSVYEPRGCSIWHCRVWLLSLHSKAKPRLGGGERWTGRVTQG